MIIKEFNSIQFNFWTAGGRWVREGEHANSIRTKNTILDLGIVQSQLDQKKKTKKNINFTEIIVNGRCNKLEWDSERSLALTERQSERLRCVSRAKQNRADQPSRLTNSLGVPTAAGEQQGPGRCGSQMTVMWREGCGWRAGSEELVTARSRAHTHTRHTDEHGSEDEKIRNLKKTN